MWAVMEERFGSATWAKEVEIATRFYEDRSEWGRWLKEHNEGGF